MTFKDRYINPFTDFGFKKLFGTELNKDLLIDFLNEVVLPDERKIIDLTYKQTEHYGATKSDRSVIFDLHCIGSNDERFIVEMQQAKQNYFKDRSVFYTSFPIQQQGIKGEWDFKLAEVYTVGLLDFVFNEDKKTGDTITYKGEGKENSEVRHVVRLKDQHCRVFYEKLTLIYLELPKFKKTEEELISPFDKWLYVLKNLPRLDQRPEKLKERIFERLFRAAEIAKFTREEQDVYETSIKNYRDLKNVLDTAFGEAEIREAKGKAEGKAEENKARILKALQARKWPDADIAELFEITIDQVLQIKKENGL